MLSIKTAFSFGIDEAVVIVSLVNKGVVVVKIVSVVTSVVAVVVVIIDEVVVAAQGKLSQGHPPIQFD